MTVTLPVGELLIAVANIVAIVIAWMMMSNRVSLVEQGLATALTRVESVEEDVDDHRETLKAVTRLEEQVRQLSDQLSRFTHLFDRAVRSR